MALTNDEVDESLAAPVHSLVVALMDAGRSRRQALQDIRRVVNRLEADIDEGVFAGW